MAWVEILENHDMTVEKWNADIFKEYLRAAYWNQHSGGGNAAVHMVEDLKVGAGSSVNIGLRTKLRGGRVEGNATGIGNEGTFSIVNEKITVDNKRILAKIKNLPMTVKRVNFNILTEAKMAIVEASQEQYDDDITTELSSVDNGRVQGRYIYGTQNYNATHATALATIDNTADKFSTSMIEVAKRKAQIPINATAKIRPIRVVTGKGKVEWFACHIHPFQARDLKKDNAWRNAHLNLPPQSNSSSPIYTGIEWLGAWEGVQVYNYEGIELQSSTIQVATALFTGAQAIGVAWAQRSKFSEEFTDHKYNVSYNSGEIRGMERLVFNRTGESGTEEDHGLIHVYSAAVSD
jgi:hypothetical protein